MKQLLIFFVFLIPFTASAQRPQPDENTRKEIESLRVAVFSRVLNLTAEEAQKFWPVFNAYVAETDKLHKEEREAKMNLARNAEKMSDKEIEAALDKMLAMDQRKLDLRKRFISDAKKVLPMKKVALIGKAEREFKKELLQKFREKREAEE